jgi:hypothetical protein
MVVAVLQQKPRFRLPVSPQERISPLDSARYTIDMLENLRKIARKQGHDLLAHLLELAQMEARMVVRDAPRQPLQAPSEKLAAAHWHDFAPVSCIGDNGEAAIHGQRPADQTDPAARRMQHGIGQHRAAAEQEESDP